MKRRKKKEILKDATGLVGASIALPMGARVVAATGGSAAPITTMTSYMPTVGNILGAGMAVSLLRGLETSAQIPKKKKRKSNII